MSRAVAPHVVRRAYRRAPAADRGAYRGGVPLLPDPEDPSGSLLVGDDGRPLGRTRLRREEGVAGRTRVHPGADVTALAAQARRDLAGLRVATSDDRLADALLAAGAELHRVAVDLRHDLAGPLPAEVVPAG